MNEIMPHAQWMKLTDGGFTSIRSSELRKLDKALATYEKSKKPADLDLLRRALVGWMQAKGANWKTSVRNKRGAVENLYKQVMDLPGKAKTGADIVALSHLRNESRAIVTDLFCGKSLEFRPGFLQKLAVSKKSAVLNVSGAARDARSLLKPAVKGGLQAAGNGGGRMSGMSIDSFCKLIIPADLHTDVMAVIAKELPGFMTELAKAVTPFLGVITAGGGALKSEATAARDEYRRSQAQTHLQFSLSSGEPRMAIQACVRLLERELQSSGAAAAIDTTAFAGKVAGFFADAGTATNAAIGLVSSAAKLTLLIFEITRDVMERNDANKLMNSLDIVSPKVFDVCPIVGAYLVCCAPTSVMVNTVFDRFFDHGWREDVEYTVEKHIGPLREQARRVIHAHRFWIPALQNFPGVLQVNKKKLKEMAAKQGKTAMVGFGSDDV